MIELEQTEQQLDEYSKQLGQLRSLEQESEKGDGVWFDWDVEDVKSINRMELVKSLWIDDHFDPVHFDSISLTDESELMIGIERGEAELERYIHHYAGNGS